MKNEMIEENKSIVEFKNLCGFFFRTLKFICNCAPVKKKIIQKGTFCSLKSVPISSLFANTMHLGGWGVIRSGRSFGGE